MVASKQKFNRPRNFWVRGLIALIALLCLITGALLWILSTERAISGDWSTILPIVIGISGVALAIFAWLFPLSPIDTEKASERLPPPLPPPPSAPPQSRILNVPYRRNPFFTGREDVLKQLHDHLTVTKATALTQPPAISGLGGIGKTQIALEYAYRYHNEYDCILWVDAATRDTLLTSFLQLATVLELPEQEKQDQNKTKTVVKYWLTTHDHWLLIVDNAEDLSLVEEFLPPGENGHILLTTRAHALGTLAHAIEIGKMSLEESTLLLLRRAKKLAAPDALDQISAPDRATAEAIARELDGLPLALDQAGAFIEETQCQLTSYLQQYQRRQADLLHRRGSTSYDHPESVTTTWSLSFEQVAILSPMGADLLRCCAFIGPDAIPEHLILDGASELGPRLQPLVTDATLLDEAIGTLMRFSLVKRKRIRRPRNENLLMIHRLVQSVLKSSLDVAGQQTWVERIVHAMNCAFPDATDYRNWSRCQLYLPHALACISSLDQWDLDFPEAGELLYLVANYLYKQGRYAEAEPLFQRAIAIDEKVLGPEHSTLVGWLSKLAGLYKDQGNYAQAEALYQRAIAIDEKALGSDHATLAEVLSKLAVLYRLQGKYEQAEPLFQRAMAIDEKALGPEHPTLAGVLDKLAVLYMDQGKYAPAERLLQRAMAIDEKALGPEHPTLADVLTSLATLYWYQGKYEQAESLFERAIAIDEKALGPEHPPLVFLLSNLASLYLAQGKYAQAEPLLQRAIAIDEKALGPEHPTLAEVLDKLAVLYLHQGKYEQAERLFQRAMAIDEKALGPEHRELAVVLSNLASLYLAQGKYEQAERLYQRAITIDEKALGPEHPTLAEVLSNLAGLYKDQRKYAQAEPLYQRAIAIDEKALGPEHPTLARVLSNLAGLYKDQGNYAQAEPLYRRTLAIRKKMLGPEHPDTLTSLNTLAKLYVAEGKYAEAEPLYRRTLAVREKMLGPEHPHLAELLNDLANLYVAEGKYKQAEPLFQRAITIRERMLGPEHPDTKAVRGNYTQLQQKMKKAANRKNEG